MHRVTRSPHPVGMGPCPSRPSGASRAGAIRSLYPPARHSPPPRPSDRVSQLPLPPPRLPFANSELSGAQDRAHRNIKEPKRRRCSESAHMQDEGASHTGMFRISDVRSDRLSLCMFQTKRNVGGTRNQATGHFVLSVQSELLKGNRCVARADKLTVKPSSILTLSINVGLKEILRSKQKMKAPI